MTTNNTGDTITNGSWPVFPQHVCPNCGRCPTCGRGGNVYPYQPAPYPYIPYTVPWTIGTMTWSVT